MRHVVIQPRTGTKDSGALAPATVLESVQGLDRRFANAGLRSVTVLRATDFDRLADATCRTRIWLALECLQVTGSFKIRGALVAVDNAKQHGADRVVAASAGNHGAGVARAARVLGLDATIVVPRNAPRAKVDRMAREGADIIRVGRGYDEAEQHALALADQEGIPFLSPYDDPLVAAGNGASLAFEISEVLGANVDHVIAPIGGGGLATGLAWGLGAARGEDPTRTRRVWTAQSDVSPAFELSIERGAAVTNLAPIRSTLAEGLEGGISVSAFDRARAVVGGVSVVSEQEIAEAMVMAFEGCSLRIEGSAAVGLAVIAAGLPSWLLGGDVVVVITGRNVDEASFSKALSRGSGASAWSRAEASGIFPTGKP